MGRLFDNLFRKRVIDNSVQKTVHLLIITHTGSVFIAVMRLVVCINSSFRGDGVALNIAKTGAFSKNRLQRVKQG